jgi:spore germination protein GerM
MKKILLGLAGLLIFGVLAGYGIGWYIQQNKEPLKRIPIVAKEALPPRAVQLYFAAEQGGFLVPEMRQIPGCDDDRACIGSLLAELSRGPQQQALPVLPAATRVLSLEVENDLVRIDFSRQLVDHHPGGSLAELLTVYSLANSLAENFSYLRQVQILVDGKSQQTLKGHVRIDQPVYADFNFSRPPRRGAETQNKQDLQQ